MCDKCEIKNRRFYTMYRKVLVFLLTVLVVIAIAGCWIL